MEAVIREKVKLIDGIISRMNERKSARKEPTLVDILKGEIEKLRALNEEYEAALKGKSVARVEETGAKTKYSLWDGSKYVINKKKGYKYLIDARTEVITYQFDNGQVERTFPCGLKEVRFPDGSIMIKSEEGDYDIIRSRTEMNHSMRGWKH